MGQQYMRPTGRFVHRRSQGICTIGVWGPNAEATMSKIVTDQSKPYDVSQAGFPYGAVRDVLIDGVPCTMFRFSYNDAAATEIYTNMEHGLRLWDTIAEAGKEFEIIPSHCVMHPAAQSSSPDWWRTGKAYNPLSRLARPR